MFTLLAQPRAPRISLVKGALLGAVGFEVLKAVALLLIAQTKGQPAFQAFGVALILVVWINYFSRLVMLAAAWAYTSPGAVAQRAGGDASPRSRLHERRLGRSGGPGGGRPGGTDSGAAAADERRSQASARGPGGGRAGGCRGGGAGRGRGRRAEEVMKFRAQARRAVPRDRGLERLQLRQLHQQPARWPTSPARTGRPATGSRTSC